MFGWFNRKRANSVTPQVAFPDNSVIASQSAYQEWMDSPSPMDSIANFYALSKPGVSYVPRRVLSQDINLRTHSPFQCPSCATPLTESNVDDLVCTLTTTCINWHRIPALYSARLNILPSSVPALDAGNIAGAKWFHASASPTWDQDVVNGDGFIAHIGTYASAQRRALDFAMDNNVKDGIYMYEVTVSPRAEIDPVVFPDLEIDWDFAQNYYQGDVTRYLNRHEDAGSISLMVTNLSVITVRKVAVLNFSVFGEATTKKLIAA